MVLKMFIYVFTQSFILPLALFYSVTFYLPFRSTIATSAKTEPSLNRDEKYGVTWVIKSLEASDR